MLWALAVTTITGIFLVVFVRFHLLIDFPSIHFGHHQVEQDQVGMVFADDFKTFFTAIGATDFEPAAAEDQANQVYHFRFIFNTEDHLCVFFCHLMPPEWIKFTTNNILPSFHLHRDMGKRGGER